MFEVAYRRRLDADIARWQIEGVITPTVGDAIRRSLGPRPKGMSVATVVAIVGGLLIAAAFLAFIAANWPVIPRPARLAILLTGIAAAFGIGAEFDRRGRTVLGDLGATVGSIIFGAAIALVGQMYHLGEDFAGGMFLWAAGALLAAVLTGSRGALAVALVAGCVWTGARASEAADVPHLPFVVFWLAGALLAVAWNAVSARHAVAVAAVVWWAITAFVGADVSRAPPTFALAAGASLLFGAGLLLAICRPDRLRSFGVTSSAYGAFALIVPALAVVINREWTAAVVPWMTACAVAGLICAAAAAVIIRRIGPVLAAISICLVLLATSGLVRPAGSTEPWHIYALSISAMLCLVISGMLDEVQPRVVAGWIGLASVIGAITWAVRGSLLRRAVFLAVAGAAAVALASLLGRLKPREQHR